MPPGLAFYRYLADFVLCLSSIRLVEFVHLIDKLLRKRLIRRDRGDIDGRVVRLYLTSAGERVVRSAPQPARGVLPDALEHLPPTTLRGLDQQLANLLRRMRVHATAGGMLRIQEI